ncbi:MAG: hypothetical protein HY799_03100 [Nitrosomonadales bacterium]|nr:hypothetical protein [Nitrosomonadales bacterium]
MTADKTLLNPSKDSRKSILEILELPSTFTRAFDLIRVPGHINTESEITAADKNSITLIELKTTQKYLPSAPKGFFFGATENEFELARKLGDQFLFCFVCLHSDSKCFHTLTLDKLQKLIRNKRTQFQINL